MPGWPPLGGASSLTRKRTNNPPVSSTKVKHPTPFLMPPETNGARGRQAGQHTDLALSTGRTGTRVDSSCKESMWETRVTAAPIGYSLYGSAVYALYTSQVGLHPLTHPLLSAEGDD